MADMGIALKAGKLSAIALFPFQSIAPWTVPGAFEQTSVDLCYIDARRDKGV